MKFKLLMLTARCFFRIGKWVYVLSDASGESDWTLWMQKPFDHIADFLISISAKCVSKAFWNIQPSAEQDE